MFLILFQITALTFLNIGLAALAELLDPGQERHRLVIVAVVMLAISSLIYCATEPLLPIWSLPTTL